MFGTKNNDYFRSSRRFRWSRSNENGTGSSTEDDGKKGDNIRVGHDYQAVIEDLIPVSERNAADYPDRSIGMWCPNTDIPEDTLEEYVSNAYKNCGYSEEQALGFLLWYHYDLEKATRDMYQFKPYPEEWTSEEKIQFEQAHSVCGKNFRLIRQVLPDKTIGSLVRHYYLWKATRNGKSVLDRQARRYSRRRGTWECVVDDGADQQEANWDTEVKDVRESVSETVDITCSNCGLPCDQLHSTSKGLVCSSCFSHWTGKVEVRPRPSCSGQSLIYTIRKPPKGMYIDLNDLIAMAEGPGGKGEEMFKELDHDIVWFKRQVRINVQVTSALKFKVDEGIEECRPPRVHQHINPQWTNEELYLAVQGVRKYGLDFAAIADVIGNKTDYHIKSFFINYQQFFNLNAVLRDYEADQLSNQDNEAVVELGNMVPES